MLINGIFCAAGLEDKITPALAIDFIGPYQPSTFKFNGEVKGVKPSDLADFESPIMPNRWGQIDGVRSHGFTFRAGC